ncbi:MAG: hypothetical protein WC996_10225 [Peptostreptococcales bacterium]
MKKILVLLLAVVMIFSFIACSEGGKDQGNNNNLEGSLEDILAKIYDTVEVGDSFNGHIKDSLMTTPITSENIVYYLGKEDIEFEDAIASEPMIQPGAFSLCLVRVKEDADIEKIKADIKENVDPMKWICVGVEPENVIVDNIGDVVFLIMSNDQAKPMHDAFLALKG